MYHLADVTTESYKLQTNMLHWVDQVDPIFLPS